MVGQNFNYFFPFLCLERYISVSCLVLGPTENQDVTEIADAFKLLSPTLGSAWASVIFAVALLGVPGRNSLQQVMPVSRNVTHLLC